VHSASDESRLESDQTPATGAFDFDSNGLRADFRVTGYAGVGISALNDPVVVVLRFDLEFGAIGQVSQVDTVFDARHGIVVKLEPVARAVTRHKMKIS
jgi:hypothetical protein